MRLINRRNFFPVLGIILLFVYYYISITGYFYAFDETKVASNKIELIGALELVIIISMLMNSHRSYDRVISAWELLLGAIIIITYLLSFVYRLPSFVYYIIVLLPLLVLLFINSIIVRYQKKSIVSVAIATIVLLGAHYGYQYIQTMSLLVQDVMITNASYVLLLFLPLALCADNKIIRYVLMLLIALAVISSNKRGGTIAYVLSLFVFLLVKNRASHNEFKMKHLLFSIIVVSVSLYYLFSFSEKQSENYLANRFGQFEEDAGSGRIDAYTTTWEMITSSDFPSLFIGHGWNAVLRDSPLRLSAHNDFLEVLYDYGLVVFIFYLVLYFRLFTGLKLLIKRHSLYAGQYACALTLFFVLSLVSHIIIYEQIVTIVIIVFSCLIHFDKIDRNENRNISIPISH